MRSLDRDRKSMRSRCKSGQMSCEQAEAEEIQKMKQKDFRSRKLRSGGR